MPQIDTVVTNVGYPDALMERLRAAFRPAELVRAGSRAELIEALDRADVAVIRGDVEPAFLKSTRLRWVHCDKAGLDGSAWPDVFRHGLLVTSSAGRSDAALAEHVLYFMLSLAYDAPSFHGAQQRRQWGVAGADRLRALSGQTVGIVGMGHIGSAVAVRCRALGMRVLGYRRRDVAAPEGVERVYCLERRESLAPLLAESDFLVLAVPLTDRTHGMIGAAELRQMKSSAFLVNIARGALTDEASLAEALSARRLAGAGLDAFTTEPLPRDNPLWRTPRTMITPHVTPRLADRTERSIAIIGENARRYRNGEPMLNLLTAAEMYSRAVPTPAPPASTPDPTMLARRILRRLRRAARRPDQDG